MPESHFYTGRGDDGSTGLLGPDRVPKHDPRPEAVGAADEAQAALGLARASAGPETACLLLQAQRDLYTLMAELAAAGQADSPFAGQVTAEHVGRLEAAIAGLEERVRMPRAFVIPGDSPAGACLHVARSVVRRAEREAVRLAHAGLLGNPQVLAYLNRLSSLLFVLACAEDEAVTAHPPTRAKEGA